MKLADSRFTQSELARLRRLERELKLVGGRTYRITYRRRGGHTETIVGRFIRIGPSMSGSVREGLRIRVPNQTAPHVIDREIVTAIEEVA